MTRSLASDWPMSPHTGRSHDLGAGGRERNAFSHRVKLIHSAPSSGLLLLPLQFSCLLCNLNLYNSSAYFVPAFKSLRVITSDDGVMITFDQSEASIQVTASDDDVMMLSA